jgi:putative resolvase
MKIEELKSFIESETPKLMKISRTPGLSISIIIDGEEPKDAYQELVEDLIALVSSFAEKLYGLRSHKYEKVVGGVKQLIAE